MSGVSVLPQTTTPDEAFADNYDHLAALEHEARLMLAVASLRRIQSDTEDAPGARERLRDCFPFLPSGTSLAQAKLLLKVTAGKNRLREAATGRSGAGLHFNELCLQRDLGPFERSTVLLLFMQFTAPAFMDIFRKCQFETEKLSLGSSDTSNGMLISTLLSVICSDYREQIGCRRHFSLESHLVKHEIIVNLSGMGATTNILGTRVGLHERIVRLILGDRNLYRSSMRFIRRERGAVSLDQVILSGNLKDEVVAVVGNFLEDRAAGKLDALDSFFGYGTGLALLFHGPSGTGKTMLARALASRFGRELITFAERSIQELRLSAADTLAILFREAEMQGCIVLLDECDDLFLNNSQMSQALLVELEKARCVVILATNKPIDLDPAMERRVAMKVSFPIPDADLRLRMWRSLLPEGLELAPDVDLAEFASRYQYSGGLIKNCILLAATLASRDARGDTRITRAHLARAADLQRPLPSDEGRFCRKYAPDATLAGLQLRTRDKDEILGAARAWQQLKGLGLGFNVLISASDVATGVQAAEALARECGLEMRQFDYAAVQSTLESNGIVDPVTQRKVSPLDYAFSETLGAAAMTLFVDHARELERILAREPGKEKSSYLNDLEAKLRANAGLCCMVTSRLKPQPLPVEFHLHFALEHPPEHVQIRRWEECLKNEELREDELVALVERTPMHVGEIDFMARQASVLAVIRGGAGRPGLSEVREVIGRYRGKARSVVLFGGA